MARIKIVDLPRDVKVSKEEMKRIRGGALGVFFKIDGLTGESSDYKHKNDIELLALDPLR